MSEAETLASDIAIIGGGLVGHSLCAALRQSRPELSICMLEATSQPDTQQLAGYSPAFDDRSTALSLGSAQLLEHWQLWSPLQPLACTIEQIEISEQGGLKTAWLEADQIQQPAMGYVLPNRWLGQHLYQHSQQLGIQILHNAEVQQLSFTANHAVLHCQDQRQIQAKLVVLADGGRSGLKQALGIQTQVLDFHQQAIIANIETSEAHQHRAYERFTGDGAIALLPLIGPDQKPINALVWSVSDQRLPDLMSLSDTEFLNQAQKTFGGRLGRWQRVSKRHHYPLKRSFTPEQVRSRLVLLGNSAVSLHPIAGQGLNLALRAVSALVSQLTQYSDPDPGNLTDLLAYQRRIEKDQQILMDFCDGLIKGFAIHGTSPKLLRAMGIGLLDQHSLVKSAFARVTMGKDHFQRHERR